ncbi:MAG: helix-turn-helix transcriptional regulator [Sedimentibacter sp.]|nr:helix-turn-helix transcriptional regulator [Sedimentibacter sp.]
MDYQQIGQRIRNEREKLGLTVEKLSEIIDLTPNYLGKVERGEKKPSLQTLVKISSCLRASLDRLVYGEVQVGFIDTTELQELISKCSKHEVTFVTDMIKTMLPHINNSQNKRAD